MYPYPGYGGPPQFGGFPPPTSGVIYVPITAPGPNAPESDLKRFEKVYSFLMKWDQKQKEDKKKEKEKEMSKGSKTPLAEITFFLMALSPFLGLGYLFLLKKLAGGLF